MVHWHNPNKKKKMFIYKQTNKSYPPYKLPLVALLLLMSCYSKVLLAQYKFENTMSQYYQNRTMLNPSFTGMDGNKINIIQNRSWIGFDGAPVLTVISGEMNFGKNSAGGLQILSDVSGVVYRTTGLLNYAYRIKLDQKSQLRLGIGLSVSSERLDSRMIDASTALDPLIAANINQKAVYDGNLGIVYEANKLTLSASFFRISENLSKNQLGNADLILLKAGGYYHLNKEETDKVQFVPIVLFSVFKNEPLVMDFGSQFVYNQLINTMLIYQTTGNIRAGAGLMIKNFGEANFYYNTNFAKAGTNAQQFEIGLGFNLGHPSK